jgi:hypothetical protein
MDDEHRGRATDPRLAKGGPLHRSAKVCVPEPSQPMAPRNVVEEPGRGGHVELERIQRPGRRGSAIAVAMCDPLRRPEKLRHVDLGEWPGREVAYGSTRFERVGQGHATIHGRGERSGGLRSLLHRFPSPHCSTLTAGAQHHGERRRDRHGIPWKRQPHDEALPAWDPQV